MRTGARGSGRRDSTASTISRSASATAARRWSYSKASRRRVAAWTWSSSQRARASSAACCRRLRGGAAGALVQLEGAPHAPVVEWTKGGQPLPSVTLSNISASDLGAAVGARPSAATRSCSARSRCPRTTGSRRRLQGGRADDQGAESSARRHAEPEALRRGHGASLTSPRLRQGRRRPPVPSGFAEGELRAMRRHRARAVGRAPDCLHLRVPSPQAGVAVVAGGRRRCGRRPPAQSAAASRLRTRSSSATGRAPAGLARRSGAAAAPASRGGRGASGAADACEAVSAAAAPAPPPPPLLPPLPLRRRRSRRRERRRPRRRHARWPCTSSSATIRRFGASSLGAAKLAGLP